MTSIRAAIEKAIGYLSEHPEEAPYTDSVAQHIVADMPRGVAGWPSTPHRAGCSAQRSHLVSSPPWPWRRHGRASSCLLSTWRSTANRTIAGSSAGTRMFRRVRHR